MNTCDRHPDRDAHGSCRVCRRGCCTDCTGPAGVCTSCWYRVLVLIIVVMVIGTYSSWILLL
ncbi:MAG: hypothetical protein ACP5C4_02845 [Methanomicrobiales archaeon]